VLDDGDGEDDPEADAPPVGDPLGDGEPVAPASDGPPPQPVTPASTARQIRVGAAEVQRKSASE
jgi:hypothetical protein